MSHLSVQSPGARRDGTTSPERPPLPFCWAYFACLAVLTLKSSQALVAPQFWAEDGVLFFIQQHLDPRPLWFEPYAGYLHLVPRLIAWIASQFPAEFAPAIYAYAAVGLGAGAIATLRHAAARLDLPFLLLLAAIASMPVSSEVLGRLTNLQWLLQFHLLGVAVACRLGHRSKRPALAAAAVLMSSLTGPFSIFTVAGLLAAEGVLRLAGRAQRRTPAEPAWWSAPELWALYAGAAVQAVVLIVGGEGGGSRIPGWADLEAMALALQSHLLVAQPRWPVVLTMTAIASVYVAALTGPDMRRVRFAAIVSLVAAAQLLATMLKFAGHAHDLVPWQNGDRYFVLFRVVFWWLVLLAALAIPRCPKRWALGGYVAVLVLVTALANGRHLRQQTLDDLQWRRHAACIGAGQAVRVPIHPRPWTIDVPGTASGPFQCTD